MNAGEMAALLGTTRPTIARWVDQGAPCVSRGRPGVSAEFDAPEFIAWWRENILAVREEKPEKLYEREQMADIELKEMKVQQMRATTIPRAAAAFAIDSMFLQIGNVCRQGARRFAHRIVGVPDTATAVEVMGAIAEEMLADLRLPEVWRSLADNAEQSAAEIAGG